jgi:D-3-phosphoglycerate dehydrogenase
MKPVLLITIPLPDDYLSKLESRFDVLLAPEGQMKAICAGREAEVEWVLTNGTVGFSAAEMDLLPKLRLVSALGAGYENIDTRHAKARGIVTSNGSGTNDDTVADHAMALMLSAVRRIPYLDRATRQGAWRDSQPMDRTFSRKRVGIIGLGHIGKKIARRSSAFDCEIGYHTRSQRQDSPYQYFTDVVALATWSDFLVVATPGGAETKHLINADVLTALGENGYLVNIARGSVVDTAALAAAIAAGTIAGAGLDVYESEPEPPAALLEFDQVVLTPHIAGRSHDAIRSSVENFLANVERTMKGEPVSTPI